MKNWIWEKPVTETIDVRKNMKINWWMYRIAQEGNEGMGMGKGEGGSVCTNWKVQIKQAKTIKYGYKANRLITIQLQLAAYHICYLIRNW